DIYVNLAGGLTVDEPALDLPLALALASSLRDRPIPSGTVAIGEVGLLGELRSVTGLERRLREAARLGFDRAIVPRASRSAAAAVGGVVGLALAASAHVFSESPSGGWLLVAWVVAWVVVGFAILPYLTVVPAGWLLRQIEQLSTAEFVTAVVGLLLGLLMGLL